MPPFQRIRSTQQINQPFRLAVVNIRVCLITAVSERFCPSRKRTRHGTDSKERRQVTKQSLDARKAVVVAALRPNDTLHDFLQRQKALVNGLGPLRCHVALPGGRGILRGLKMRKK